MLREFQLKLFPVALSDEGLANTLAIDITGTMAFSQQAVQLNYNLVGADWLRIRWPSLSIEPGVKDDLWQQTCFELFMSVRGSLAYQEFNFSPSGDWALYDFDRYRQLSPSQGATTVAVEARTQFIGQGANVQVNIEWAQSLSVESFDLGISVVIKTVDAAIFYFALTHCADQPDFHRRDSFVL